MNLIPPEPYTYWATVKRAIDGDTLVIDLDLGFNVSLTDVRLRIYGINCPEIGTEEGKEALRYVNEWLSMDEQYSSKPKAYKVTVKNHKKDKYGRILGEVMYIHECLGEALIKAGKAKPYFGKGEKPV